MDRREALKKLGVGGAAVVGTTAVLSSPAFAFTQATVTGSPTITMAYLSGSSGQQSTITVGSYPQGSCPASSTNSGPDTPTQGTATISWTTHPTSGVSNTGTGTTVSRTSAGSSWDGASPGFDTVDVVVKRNYTCTYSGGSKARCVQWTVTFTVGGGTGNNATFAAGSITGPSAGTACA